MLSRVYTARPVGKAGPPPLRLYGRPPSRLRTAPATETMKRVYGQYIGKDADDFESLYARLSAPGTP